MMEKFVKVGIFGDSFGDVQNGGHKHYQEVSWPSQLANTFNVTNYSMSGSGLEYSLEKLYQHEADFDKIIFISTCPNRLMINSHHHDKLVKNEQPIELFHHVQPSSTFGRQGVDDKFYENACSLAKQHYDVFVNTDHLDMRVALIWKALKDHFGDRLLLLYMSNPESVGIAGQKYLNKFNASPDNEMCLFDMCLYEEPFVFGNNERNHNFDRRSCHLTHYHHEMMYKKIFKWIGTDEFSLTEQDLIKLDPKEISEMYYGEY